MMRFRSWMLLAAALVETTAWAQQSIGPALGGSTPSSPAPAPVEVSAAERAQAVAAIGGMRMAVLGDSLSTGAATHPSLTFDTRQLWDVFNGRTPLAPLASALPKPSPVSPLPAPQRLWPAPREFLGGADWLWRNLGHALARTYLDTEEYSWGYQLGLALYPDDARSGGNFVAIAAENGARTDAMAAQAERLFAATGGALPERVFAMYTGNDLCAASLAGVTDEQVFRNALRKGLRYLAINGKAAPSGTDIYVVGFLGILQLIHSDSILDKKVFAFGGETTCRALREKAFRPEEGTYDPGLPEDAAWFGLLMPPNPAGFCATLYSDMGSAAARADLSSQLANRIRSFREIQQAVVREMAEDPQVLARSPKIRFHYIAKTSDLVFTGEDIAGDCFHLSVNGQGKVAGAIFEEIAAEHPAL